MFDKKLTFCARLSKLFLELSTIKEQIVNKFISFENADTQIDYLFNKNHYLLLLISLIVIIFFSMYLSRQKHKVQKISVFIVALLLIILEGLRIFWRYKYLQANNMNMGFANVVDLGFFTLSLWIDIPLIIIASIKKEKKKQVRGLDFVFSVSALISIINLIYPQGINTNFEFYHCYNLIFALTRSLVIMLAFVFAFAKWISVNKFLDHWKGLLCLAAFGIICVALGMILGAQNNFFYVDSCPLFDSIGIHLPFPWHLTMLACFFFVFQILLYLPFRLHNYFKNKRNG